LEFSLVRICRRQGIVPEAASSPKLTTISSLQERYGVTPGKRHSRVVIASGCFDPLHLGHVRLLEAARQKGDILVVLVMDMDAIRQHSEKNGFIERPVYNDAERVETLASLRAVNHIVLLEDRDCLASLRSFCPDTFVKNIKDQSRPVVRAEAGLVESLGGQIIYLHDLKTQYSSTAIIQEIRKRYG
jgi:rfaE bifunctional protein nucleotidyltransferase chain/domain